MAWVAIDKGGLEAIYEELPYRKEDCFWGVEHYWNTYIELPSGSIKKLIGRDLTWEDDPIELKEEE